MVVSTLLCGDLLRSHCHIFTAYWGCGLEATEIPILRRRVTLLGESPRKYRRINSSELNLAYEGLLLGMRARGHRDSNTEAHPHIRILMNLHFMMTAATHLRLFRRIKSSTRRSLGVDRAKDSRRRWRLCRRSSLCRRPQDGDGPWRRSSMCQRPLCLMTWRGGHVLHPHLWGTKIFVNLKEL
jgi:hypothetical protein